MKKTWFLCFIFMLCNTGENFCHAASHKKPSFMQDFSARVKTMTGVYLGLSVPSIVSSLMHGASLSSATIMTPIIMTASTIALTGLVGATTKKAFDMAIDSINPQ
ncbi:MAG: hypothetical protein HAW62_02010, partial [Endozoicomonadaceae bacterium]|nr:hypothetical protein [Endozoicomonadaceae bacterium]